MYYVGARQVLEGALTLGDLTVFATYLLMLYQPLEQLSYTAWAMEGAAAGAARCFEVLDREDECRTLQMPSRLRKRAVTSNSAK